MDIPGVYYDKPSMTLKLRRFLGFNKAGDEGNMSPDYSYGGIGFDASNGFISAAHQDFIFDELATAIAGCDSYVLHTIFYYTRMSTANNEERFLLAVLSLTSGSTTTVKLFAQYLPRTVGDTSFPTDWTDITGTAVLTTAAGRSFINYQEGVGSYVAFTNGTGDPYVWAGVLATPIAKLNASAPKALLMAYYNDRAFLANIVDNPNVIKWSVGMAPSNWTESSDGAGWKIVVSGRGDYLTAIHANRVGLMAYKNDSTYRLYGTMPTDFQFVLVSNECGAVNGQCVAELGNVVFQLDKSGLMYFDGSNLRPYMQDEMALPTDNAYFASDEFRDKHAVFAYGDRLYVYDGYSYQRYRINPAKKIIESVTSHEDTQPVIWLPMRDMCMYVAKKPDGKDAIYQVGDGLSGRVVLYAG